MKRWEEDMPDDVWEVRRKGRKLDNTALWQELRREVGVVTPMSEIRALARKYSDKYNVPIKVSADAFEAMPDADAMYNYHYNKAGKVVGTIYLHPVLQYYPWRYVDGVIRHELGHYAVEVKWEDKL